MLSRRTLAHYPRLVALAPEGDRKEHLPTIDADSPGLVFQHGDFGKNAGMGEFDQEPIRESVEDARDRGLVTRAEYEELKEEFA